MAQITKDTMIGELLRDQEHIEDIAEVLFGIGMHCLDARLPRWRPWKRLLWFTGWSRTSWLHA